MRTGSHIQFGFLALKLLPVLFVIAIGLLFFAPAHVFSLPAIWTGIPSCIPLVLYAAMGFEAICAISNKIEDAERNGPKSNYDLIRHNDDLGIFIPILILCNSWANIGRSTKLSGRFSGIIAEATSIQILF